MTMKTKLNFALLLSCFALQACITGFAEHRTGVADQQLLGCPPPPRCVSSTETRPERSVAPLEIRGAPEFAFASIAEHLAGQPRTTLLVRRADYLHAEIISPWHFYTDDLELLMLKEQGLIQIRSTGRIGYYDFDVNRDRVEALRAALAAKGLVKPAR